LDGAGTEELERRKRIRRMTNTRATMIQFFIEIYDEKKYVLNVNGQVSQGSYCCCRSPDFMDIFQPTEKDDVWVL